MKPERRTARHLIAHLEAILKVSDPLGQDLQFHLDAMAHNYLGKSPARPTLLFWDRKLKEIEEESDSQVENVA